MLYIGTNGDMMYGVPRYKWGYDIRYVYVQIRMGYMLWLGTNADGLRDVAR
jgi:predicted nucleotidyltransferase